MNMVQRLGLIAFIIAVGLGVNWWTSPIETARTQKPMSKKLEKSDAEWRTVLTDEQYYVTRQRGTERAFTGEYWNTKDDGVYACVCCGTPLFDARNKFDSGCGWPSFWSPSDEDHIEYREDRSHFMNRIEIVCKTCDAHLGHVFDDGPPPTGKRYCINSASLKLQKRTEPK